MEIRHLEYAVVLAETLHFGRAAERVYIGQSAFSTHIARLEKEVGALLFDRSANRVRLTVAGENFVKRAEKILEDLSAASLEAQTLQKPKQQELTVGLFHESAGELTPLIINAYQRAIPNIRLGFRRLTMTDQLEAVAEGDVDVAFLRTPIEDNRLSLVPLFSEPRFVGLAENHKLAQQPEILVSDLLDEEFALASPQAPGTWRRYWALDDLRGEPSRVATTVTTVWDSVTAIAFQNAVDTFPQSATRMHQIPGMVYRKIVDGTYSTSVIATRKGALPAHVEAFIQIALQLAQTSSDVVEGAVAIVDGPHETSLSPEDMRRHNA